MCLNTVPFSSIFVDYDIKNLSPSYRNIKSLEQKTKVSINVENNIIFD